ncbi:hypothetical protein D3C72_238570 [compost metagenome]
MKRVYKPSIHIYGSKKISLRTDFLHLYSYSDKLTRYLHIHLALIPEFITIIILFTCIIL